MKVELKKLKELREKTGVSLMKCREALEESSGDPGEALKFLQAWGAAVAEKKAERVTASGLVEAYTHANGKVASIVKVACETDFVARTADFKELAHELAMQIAAMDPKNVKELLGQEYIREPERIVDDLLKEKIAKLGENIKIEEFVRLEL
ncbi:translation elongation factor Ts [Candidatus Shapirobacteria bacterium]|nr:translation elongation factor Ts [Candidatus Shapirobacteria bacterium]